MCRLTHVLYGLIHMVRSNYILYVGLQSTSSVNWGVNCCMQCISKMSSQNFNRDSKQKKLMKAQVCFVRVLLIHCSSKFLDSPEETHQPIPLAKSQTMDKRTICQKINQRASFRSFMGYLACDFDGMVTTGCLLH